MGLFVPLGLDYFLFHVWEFFNYNLFKNFLIPSLFLLFFWDPCNLNVGAFDMVPMATHSSVLAWRIPGTGEPGALPSMGSHRVGHD